MNAESPSPAASGPLFDARVSFNHGRIGTALAQLRALDMATLDATAACEAQGLRALAAFRSGELAEAAEQAALLMNSSDSGHQALLALRFDTLAVDVVASGELLHFGRSLSRLRELLSLAVRLGGLAHWVRARGSAATCFVLLGDAEAGRRVLAGLAGSIQGPQVEPRLEATVRGNLASVCLTLARQARAAGDTAAEAHALEDAEASVQCSRDIAQRLGDERVAAFVRVHDTELALLRAPQSADATVLAAAAAAAAASGLHGHERQLTLLQAELLLERDEHTAALALLQPLRQRLNEGHEYASRVRLHGGLARALHGLGRLPEAWAERDEADRLQALRLLRQAQAQSAFVRHRLELEHLFSHRPATAAAGTTP